MAISREFLELIESYRAPLLAGLGEALSTPPQVSVRVNPLKTAVVAAAADRVPWCPEGFYLPERPRFTFSPELHQGLYYVQDASSMFIGHVLRTLVGSDRPVRYLDACAAPGGKTTAACSALHPDSVITANEFVPARAAVLRENVAKWGSPFVTVTSGPVSRFTPFEGYFDVIAADVPCSGEGMMRKDAEAVAQWSPELVEQCAARQRDILSALWPALTPGGLLIYSTCTFNRTENEDMLHWLAREFGAESVEVPGTDPSWGIGAGIDTPMACYRFVPGRVRGEGLFMGVVRKPLADAGPAGKRKEKPAKGGKMPAEARRVLDMLLPRYAEGAAVSMEGSDVVVTPAVMPGTNPALTPRLVAATLKGRDLIPSQRLALSAMYRRGAVPEAEVSAEEAIAYLSGNPVAVPDAPKGVVLLLYRGHPLGFVKNLGSRANNLYPKPWRILTAGAPEEPPLPFAD